MNLDKACALVREFEGLRLNAYLCSANKATIGYGHTRGVKIGDTCTREQAEQWLEDDLNESLLGVQNLVKIHINENQTNALVDFVFNLGAKNLQKSTLLKELNKGLYDQVPQQLMRWNKVNGEELGGLTRRRAAEAKLWNA